MTEIQNSPYQYKYRLFSVGAIGTFMATLDGSILNVALPTISNYFEVPMNIVAWVALSYNLTLISLMLIFGVWIGRKGYRFGYNFGFTFFIIGSILCVVSTNFWFLIFGRVVQAVGTAMFAAIGPGMITTVFPEEERGKGIGMMVMMVSAGFMVGPPVGGFLLTFWPWQALFLVNIPIGFVGIYMALKYFKKIVMPVSERKLNLIGALSMSAALLSFTFFLSMFKEFDVNNQNLWILLGMTIIFGSSFLYFESKPDTAMIGIEIFKNRQFTTAIAAMFFMFISIAGILIIVPFYLEQIKLFEPKQVGLYLIILPVMLFIFAPISGRISDKIGFRFLTSFGVLVMIAGFYFLSKLTVDSSNLYIMICLSLLGMGNGIFNTPNSSSLMGAVTETQRAVTSSILATTRNIGISSGVALSTALFAFLQVRNLELLDQNVAFLTSYRTVIYVSIGFSVLCLLVSLSRANRNK